MKLDISKLEPGDVVIVKMGNWFLRVLIWIQAFVTMKSPRFANYGHVAVVDHFDTEGRLWGIEARPKGIGWRLMDTYNGKYGVSNKDQPKTLGARVKLVEMMQQLMGMKYDYTAYLEIALSTLGINKTWKDFTGNDIPVSFICSAVADYVYEEENLPNPGGFEITRFTTPAQWAKFCIKKEWEESSLEKI